MYFQNCFLLKHFTGLWFISKGSDHLNHSNTMMSYDVWVIKLGDLILKETACWMCEWCLSVWMVTLVCVSGVCHRYPQPMWTWWRALGISQSVCVSGLMDQLCHPSPQTHFPQWAQSLQRGRRQYCLGYCLRADGGDSCDADDVGVCSLGDGEDC